MRSPTLFSGLLGLLLLGTGPIRGDELGSTRPGPVLDKRALLDAETFWDDRDRDWYAASIPFFECPDKAIQTTYYYRWELITKHRTYGSPATGYVFTEFLDRPFWSGTYGAISCPAGLQLAEVRWLRDPTYARDYARYWYKTPGAEPRNYSTWLADAAWGVHLVHPEAGLVELLPAMVANQEGWIRDHFDPAVGLYWQTGHDDGMELNINSAQTTDWMKGAPAYRPTLNSYLWADDLAIARFADLAGRPDLARTARARADAIKANLQAKLWDPSRSFFFPMARRDEAKDGHVVKAGSLTYQTGKFAGDPHGRELIGFVPWQFGLPDSGFAAGWAKIADPGAFKAPFGPTCVEQGDPLFKVTDSCCVWSGQSWPYATTQTLKAMANLLQGEDQRFVTRADYLDLLATYSRTQRKDGRPYIAEGANPFDGSWRGYDSFDHSEHYFHSGFVDPIITGLVGLKPRADDLLEVDPLAPASWPYFAVDDVPYRGHLVSILWDADGTRYGRGRGLHLIADGRTIARSESLARIEGQLPPAAEAKPIAERINLAANNDGGYYPRVDASSSDPSTPPSKANDGVSWYMPSPPNRWAAGENKGTDPWFLVDFGTPRRFDEARLYLLDDGGPICPPDRISLEAWDGRVWTPIVVASTRPVRPEGHRANVFRFAEVAASKVRATLSGRPGNRPGLSEFEVWGTADQPVGPVDPAGDLAFNPGDRPFPKASASFTCPVDQVDRAINGRVNFGAKPSDRWTAYDSPNSVDWLEVDFGAPTRVARAELAVYDDRGGVKAPRAIGVQTWDGSRWSDAEDMVKDPERPVGGRYNAIRFRPVDARKVRFVFDHPEGAKSGVSEVFLWRD